MTPESRLILEAIRDCRTKEEAELMVKLHGFYMRVYHYGSYVRVVDASAWDVFLDELDVHFHRNDDSDVCSYQELPVVLAR